MKNNYTISRQFQDDLIKAYNKVMPTVWSLDEAYRLAVKQPAPRYYVSARQAAQVIAQMVRGNFERVDIMLPNRKRMYYSLFDRVMDMSEKRQYAGKSLAYIVKFAVISPAPEFFCSHLSLIKVRSFLRRGYFNDEGAVVNCKTREVCYERKKEKRRKIKEYRAQFQ